MTDFTEGRGYEHRCPECGRIAVWTSQPGETVQIVHDEAERLHGIAIGDEITEGEEPLVWYGYSDE